jgi:oligopeptidase B
VAWRSWWPGQASGGRIDEFAHLDSLQSRATLRQLAVEAAFVSEVMAPTIPLQMELYDEMAAAQPAAHEGEAEVRAGWAYYTRSPPRRDLPLFCRRPVDGGAEQVLLDLGTLADRHGYAAIGKLAGSVIVQALYFRTCNVRRRGSPAQLGRSGPKIGAWF